MGRVNHPANARQINKDKRENQRGGGGERTVANKTYIVFIKEMVVIIFLAVNAAGRCDLRKYVSAINQNKIHFHAHTKKSTKTKRVN